MRDLDIVGVKARSVNSNQIVRGRARYCADLPFSGLLTGKLLYSSYPSARILNIDTSKALGLQGVAAVLTHKDVPGKNSYLYSYLDDHPLFVTDYVRYQGDIIAAVAAESEEAALAAINSIEVEYEPLPGIYDVLEAMKPDSRRVWPDRGNVYKHLVIENGNIEKGFDNADIIINRTYSTQWVEHVFLETETAVAKMDDDGTVVVYASTQAPHRDRFQIARALALPENAVRVITPHIGGGFGGKDEAHVQIHAALLAQSTGKSVLVQRTREESILTHVKRHPVIIRYKTGATSDGKIIAVHVEAIGDTGPYLGAGEYVMNELAELSAGPYLVPNARVEAYTVLTNNPICGACRGFGAPQANFVYERQMDELARTLGMDPLEIRRLNGLRTGDQMITGMSLREAGGMKACLNEAARLSEWGNHDPYRSGLEPHMRRGWGIACTIHTVGIGRNLEDHASASLQMLMDGSVILRTGAADMGQGVHTVLAQLAAETLGVELSSVKIVAPDTEVTLDAGASVATRQTFISGNAVLSGCTSIRKTLIDLASQETGFDTAMLDLRKGYVYAQDERLSLKIADLATIAIRGNIKLSAEGYYTMDFPEELPNNAFPHVKGAYTFGTQIAKVLVDTETGKVKVEEIIAVHDVGKVINPDGVRTQIEGGVIMGLGWSLMEELIIDQGKTLNTSFDSYLIPTSKDIPKIITGFVEIPEPYGPMGAKGIGEPSINPTAPAIANAVSNAIGAPMDKLPITPELVLEALKKKSG